MSERAKNILTFFLCFETIIYIKKKESPQKPINYSFKKKTSEKYVVCTYARERI